MIYLVRHGETDLNKAKKFYGSLDVSINQEGKEQAQQLAKKLRQLDFAEIYVSGLKRTVETAELIKGSKEIPIVSRETFDEKGFGLWEGLDANQIEGTFPQAWEKWLASPFDVIPPEAEDFYVFKDRVLTTFQGIIKQKQEAIFADDLRPLLIVGHLGVLRVICQCLKPELNFWEITIPQGEFRVITQEQLRHNKFLRGVQ